MSENDDEPLKLIGVILSDSSETSIASFTKVSDIIVSIIPQKLERGVRTVTWAHSFMTCLDSLKSESETNEENSPVPSIVTRLSDYRFTFSLSHLLLISLRLETLAKRLVSLKQKLTPTVGSERRITLQALRQADSLLASMISDLVEISRILKNDLDGSSSQTPA